MSFLGWTLLRALELHETLTRICVRISQRGSTPTDTLDYQKNKVSDSSFPRRLLLRTRAWGEKVQI